MNDEIEPQNTSTRLGVYLIPWILALAIQIAFLAPQTQHWTELLSFGGLCTFPIGLPAFFALLFGARDEFFLTIVAPRWRVLYTVLPWLIYLFHAVWSFRERRPAWLSGLYVVLVVFLLLNIAGCQDLFRQMDKIK